MPVSGNLFSIGAAQGAGHELIETLVEQGGVTVERIVSSGQASAPGFWYDSPRGEWVVLLTGAARLEFEGDAQLHAMKPGDYLLIDAHRRHRVAWTHDSEPTVWLAIYYTPDDAAG
ncbi:MAG TPA: cupin domain-containing protein [Paraburkholderia sp.]|jgi:cupin 2 domain-containing protein|nr:cupin domain-containing protein [Paraburkholderia sp.]